ncbi:hypothetical protein K501DRAFT_274246 [Backusella circina FSU 941]|nr:hypothetical protein K501DRAFT_274246 [Backusella circina FSU 941]
MTLVVIDVPNQVHLWEVLLLLFNKTKSYELTLVLKNLLEVDDSSKTAYRLSILITQQRISVKNVLKRTFKKRMTKGQVLTLPRAFVCVKCQRSFISSDNLRKHLMNENRILARRAREFSSENVFITDDFENGMCGLPCIVCGTNNSTFEDLESHCKEGCDKNDILADSSVEESVEEDHKQEVNVVDSDNMTIHVHWTADQKNIYFTKRPVTEVYTLQDTDAYLIPSLLKAAEDLNKMMEKQRALNLDLPMNSRPTLILETSEGSRLVPPELKRFLGVEGSDSYFQLTDDMDTADEIYGLVYKYAKILDESIITDDDMLIYIFGWDVFIVDPAAGDSCASVREDDWLESTKAYVVFLEKILTFKMKASLGSSIPKELAKLSKKHFEIYVRTESGEVSSGFRLLRDYAKLVAALFWLFTSRKFFMQRLYRINPSQLWKIFEGQKRVSTKATIVSILIECYFTGKCSLRQVLERMGEDNNTFIKETIGKLNLLNQYKDSKLYEAIAKGNAKLITLFINKQ